MLKAFKYFTTREWIMAILALCFIVSQIYFDLELPDYTMEITMLTQTPGSSISEIWITGGYMMLCTLASIASSIAMGYIMAKLAAGFSQRMRSLMFNQVESFSLEDINKFSTSSLITRSTNDIRQVQMFLTMGLALFVKAPITAIWAVIKIYGKGFEWSIATLITIVCLVIIVGFIMIFVVPKFRKMQQLTDNLNRVTREQLMGVRVIRAYNAENYQKNKFEVANHDLTKTQLFTGRTMALMMPTMTILMNGLSLSIYWIGAHLINKAALSDKLQIFGDMVIFGTYAMQIVMSFLMLVMIFMFLPRASVSAKRINEVLTQKPSIIFGNKLDGNGKRGEIVFNNVNYKYPDAEDCVLQGISFSANQGETIAIIGATGSGKSTLVNLIPRFCDPTSGEIYIDGINILEYEEKALRKKIGYVSQRPVIFKGTLFDNINFGDNGSDETNVKDAIAIAQSKDFVENLDKNYFSEVAQGGTNLSGGQKQRIAIARAIARKPEMYIFDDSFSALDFKTDKALRNALREATEDATCLIVAQRIGTILDADKIIVLDEGRIVGIGSHRELLDNCSVYREIAESQLSQEELNNV
ncbi:MAG: ABC transporter ATP-binding protein/permease [Christensenellaceae bacterium]|jgi:ATP-binding cassette subfamily B protein|nr:ABC transporter ATP-binding protein/permease [Christensenellaceae bacterium]